MPPRRSRGEVAAGLGAARSTGRVDHDRRGPVDVAEAAACESEPPSAGTTDDVWIVGHPSGGPDRRRIVYGIGRMFVAEDSPLRQTTSGSVVAKVTINETFEPRLLGLVAKHDPTTP